MEWKGGVAWGEEGVGDGSRFASQAGKASLGESSSIQVREARKASV